MTIPNGPDSDAAQMIQSLRDNAARYGLTWENAMATVQDGSDPGSVSVIFDGDDSVVTIGLISTVGFLAQGERVYVLQIPPAGNYIYGRATGDYRARQTLTANQAEVTFSNIPANLRSLTLKYKARAAGGTTVDALRMRINGDTAAAYAMQLTRSNNVTVLASNAVTTSGIGGLITGAGATALWFASGHCVFEGWDLTSQLLGWDYNSTGLASVAVANFFKEVGGGIYTGLRARTSLTLFSNIGSLLAGSDFQLLGEAS